MDQQRAARRAERRPVSLDKVEDRLRTMLREELDNAGVFRLLDAWRALSEATGELVDDAELGRRTRVIIRQEAAASGRLAAIQ